jgi:hypothetical protein
VFVLTDSFFEFAQCCGLAPPLDPQAVGLRCRRACRPRIRRALNFLAIWACLVSSFPPRSGVLAFPVPHLLLFAVRWSLCMRSSLNYLPCDGCGIPASPQHIAERLRRLELSTRFRPVHVGVLFVALAPSARPEDDFYGPAESNEFADPILEALEIQSSDEKVRPELDALAADSARLAEFQRRGYYLAYLSECPLPANGEPVASTIARLGPTLIRRIRFSYKPKHVGPLGQELLPLIDMLSAAGIGPILTLEHGLALPTPRTGARDWMGLFRRAVSTVVPSGNPALEYDRIQLTQSEPDLGAGGNT